MCHWNLEGIGGVETGSGVKFILEAACSNHVIGHECVVIVSACVSRSCSETFMGLWGSDRNSSAAACHCIIYQLLMTSKVDSDMQ